MNTLEIQFLITAALFAALISGFLIKQIFKSYFEMRAARKISLRSKPIVGSRRRMESSPNVICSLPMHDVLREEAPLY